MMPHTSDDDISGFSTQLAADERDEALTGLLGLLVGWRLDHDAHEWLGAARADEHTATSAQRLVLESNGVVDPVSVCERGAIANRNVDESLRQLAHRCTFAQVATGQRLEREQRAGDAVAGAVEAHVDDVARLLAPEAPGTVAQLLEHIAVSDRRACHVDPGLAHGCMKAIVGHHGHHDAIAG